MYRHRGGFREGSNQVRDVLSVMKACARASLTERENDREREWGKVTTATTAREKKKQKSLALVIVVHPPESVTSEAKVKLRWE